MAKDQQVALNRFLASVERRAFRMAQIATGNTDDAMDIVQDAMMTLVRKYSDKPEAEWGALFHTVLQSRIRDWYRRSSVRNRLRSWLHGDDDDDTDPMDELPDQHGKNPEQRLRLDDAAEALNTALHALPLRQQQAFLLRNWEGLDIAQTAQAMGCTEGTVKTHYSRAVHALRDILEDHWQ
ncbi:MAG: RNA polymerase sigma factor [Gammaproteobacteria bacterium]|nr:RNA polymerase sigma factor [Gammaproteobacteria bacterium]